MSATATKLNEARILLGQAIKAENDQQVFSANLNAFVSAGRSVTLVMQSEFKTVAGFDEWYRELQEVMKQDPDCGFFNELRVTTIHKRPFGTPKRYVTEFQGGLAVKAGSTVIIPMGVVDERGNIVPNDASPATVNGNEFEVERQTRSTYFFEQRPNDDAVELCDAYFHFLERVVLECEKRFKES